MFETSMPSCPVCLSTRRTVGLSRRRKRSCPGTTTCTTTTSESSTRTRYVIEWNVASYSFNYPLPFLQLLLLSMASLFLGSVLLWRYLFRINLVAIVILNVLCVSLFFRYLECNRRLEFENIERTKSLTTAPNPCDRTTSFMFLSNYDSQKCTDYMMWVNQMLIVFVSRYFEISSPLQVNSRSRTSVLRSHWGHCGFCLGTPPEALHKIHGQHWNLCRHFVW